MGYSLARNSLQYLNPTVGAGRCGHFRAPGAPTISGCRGHRRGTFILFILGLQLSSHGHHRPGRQVHGRGKGNGSRPDPGPVEHSRHCARCCRCCVTPPVAWSGFYPDVGPGRHHLAGRQLCHHPYFKRPRRAPHLRHRRLVYWPPEHTLAHVHRGSHQRR